MAITTMRWRGALASIPYRELLNTPGIARAHDLQRMVSYSLGVVVALLVELPRWRTGLVLVVAAAMLVATVERAIRRRKLAPYLLAQIDQFASTTAIAIATGSPIITVAVAIFITAAIVASFAAPPRTAVVSAIITSTPAIVIALMLGMRGEGGVADYLAALVLVSLMVALATFILIFFTLQARQLRGELRSREAQLEAVLEVTPVVLATIDHDRTLTTLAGDLPDWIELAGQPLEVGSALAAVVTEAAAGARVSADVTLGDRTFAVTCDPGSGGKILLTAYDVTEQTDARLRLEELVRSKDQFIAAVSHELRTPLSSVLGFAQLAQAEIDGNGTIGMMIGEVADQSAEMAAIIDDLLVAARSSFEKVPTAPRIIDLAEEVSGVVDAVSPRLAVLPTGSFEAVHAYADPIRVRQIIRNLLTNADRYGGDRVMLQTRVSSDQAVLEVRDSGGPLPQELRDRIFEPYESSGPVRGQPAAIGLGLAVSRTLAQLMDGSLEYRHDGDWSIFELRLPSHPLLQHRSPMAATTPL